MRAKEPKGKGKGKTTASGETRPVSPVSATAATTTAAADHPAPPRLLVDRLIADDLQDPHTLLGQHPATIDGVAGTIVRAAIPDATGLELLLDDGRAVPMRHDIDRLWSAFLPGVTLPVRYRFRVTKGAHRWERGDPYRMPPALGEMDLHLFNEGNHRRLWEMLGAHVMTVGGETGVRFTVWAPNARRVSVIGDFCDWDARVYPMRALGASGVWELFIPDVQAGALYRYDIVSRTGAHRIKTDPFAFKIEQHPGSAGIVVAEGQYGWSDTEWMSGRSTRDHVHGPMLVYEVHLGSWARVPEENFRSLSYREIAPRLAEHVKTLGFTHVELLPVAEHPFTGSWGYQVSGYYAPTSRYGNPDDFRYFVDTMHQAGIGVIVDWVPAHFPKDDYALRRFDGTALYEHEDPRLGEHPDWGTLIFNFGRTEVRNFLVANALYWLKEFHVDGLRVDAVASMLYLDYSRKPGEWLRNRHGGRENLEAIDFLRMVNEVVHAEAPGCITIAEESTAWPGVTKPANEGGLGFTFKWNMGWMHDTLKFFQTDPLYRRHHHDTLTFAMMYEYSERFVMPLSHDEVVHLKGSLLHKMPGDAWQKFANLRCLLGYQVTRPGKALMFMGGEIGTWNEWNHDASLAWELTNQPLHGGLQRYVAALGQLYRESPPLWRLDHEPDGFHWIVVDDRDNSVIAYERCDRENAMIVVLNLTPVPREQYRIGVPNASVYDVRLNSDDAEFGGSGMLGARTVTPEPSPFHGFQQSVLLHLPPLAMLVLAPAGATK